MIEDLRIPNEELTNKRPDFEMMGTISSSINPGSTVLSTITKEFGDKISIRISFILL
jgi:hypothetical protein